MSTEKQLLTIVTWLVAAWIFTMMATQGMARAMPLPVSIVIGALVAFVVAWAIAVVLAE